MKFILSLVLMAMFSQTLTAQNNVDQNHPSDSTSKELNTLTVTSKYYQHYKIDNVSNTLKLGRALLLLPQNIQEVDKSIIRDQQAINVNESLTRNVSGAVRNNTADFYGPMIMMRGANIGTLRNGMDIAMAYYGPMPEDAAIIERMELSKDRQVSQTRSEIRPAPLTL